jgi:hypothetical protein
LISLDTGSGNLDGSEQSASMARQDGGENAHATVEKADAGQQRSRK